MGKASSAKKVARAVKSGGNKTSKSKQLGFPLAIIAVVVLGLGLVTYARSSSQTGSDAANPPRVGDHWHAAYGVYLCDHFAINVSDRSPDALGIHSHDDGLVHIHPFSTGAAGKQAKFARFFDQTGLQVNNSEIKLPAASPFGGRTYKEGETKCDGKPAEITVTHWKSALDAAQGKKPDQVMTKDFANIRFTEDLGAYTIAFAAKGTKIPYPPRALDVANPSDVQGGQDLTQFPGDDAPPVSADLGGATVDGSTPATDGTDGTPASDTPATAPAATDSP